MAKKRVKVKKTSAKIGSSRKSVKASSSFRPLQLFSKPYTKLVVLLIVISVFSGYLISRVQKLEKNTDITAQTDNNPLPTRPTKLNIVKPSTTEHWRGSKDAEIVIVEYSDLECLFCKQERPVLSRILSENKDKIAGVFRHYPLSYHLKAQKSAEAVECAADQGGDDAFWKMTDAIYEKMPDLELSGLAGVATSIELDGSTLQTCIDSGKFTQKVKDQQAEGAKAGVQATPSNVVYNVATGKTLLIEGALPYDQFKTKLDAFIK